MTHALAQVVFSSTTGLPEDVFVNTFHFDADDPADLAILSRLESFYNDTHAPGTAPISDTLSTVIDRTQARIKVYDMSEPEPRTPVLDSTWVPNAAATATSFPNEVSLVLSFKADPESGIPLGRTRGRVFLGPLSDANSALSGGDWRPNSTRINKWIGAGDFLAEANTAALQWCVFSAAALADGHPTGLFPVTSGFVDDAYDTQRRRGGKALSRTTFTA